MTEQPTDAVAQARDGVWGALEDWQNTTRTTAQVHRDLNSALDALIAAVREADFAAAERYAHTAMQAGGPLLDNLARAYLALLDAVARPAEARGEAVPSFWAVLREDNETMATGKTHDEAVREFLQYYQRDYAVAEKEGYRCVAIFTKWPAAPRPETGEVSGAMVEAGVEGWIAAINDSYSLSRMEQEVSRHEIVGRILRAALAAQREQTP